MFFGYKFVMKTKTVKPHEADLYTGKDKIDREEAEYIAAQLAKKGGPETRWERIYRLTLGWAF